MISRILVSGIFLSLLLAFASCKKQPVFPVEPHIEFVSFTKIQNGTAIDQKGTLELSFTDGDGDIGLEQSDTVEPYKYNFFITYLEKQHGVYQVVQTPTSFNARIPVINPDGGSKSIQGNIDIDLYINNPLSTFDTIRFDCYIFDKKLHQSNTVSTPDIIVKKH
jgi:hypothetical protein